MKGFQKAENMSCLRWRWFKQKKAWKVVRGGGSGPWSKRNLSLSGGTRSQRYLSALLHYYNGHRLPLHLSGFAFRSNQIPATLRALHSICPTDRFTPILKLRHQFQLQFQFSLHSRCPRNLALIHKTIHEEYS